MQVRMHLEHGRSRLLWPALPEINPRHRVFPKDNFDCGTNPIRRFDIKPFTEFSILLFIRHRELQHSRCSPQTLQRTTTQSDGNILQKPRTAQRDLIHRSFNYATGSKMLPEPARWKHALRGVSTAAEISRSIRARAVSPLPACPR